MKFNLATAALFLLTFNASLLGQNNPCGIKAVIDPGGDSILSTQGAVLFKSASTNATDYRFIIDVYPMELNTPVNWGFQPGLTTIKLVAYNGNCTDTAVVHYFYPGTYPGKEENSRRLYGYPGREHVPNSLIRVRSGGYLMAGNRDASSWDGLPKQGLMIKTKETGCVEWAKKLEGRVQSDIRLVTQSDDGSFYMIAEVDHFKQSISRLDPSGNVQWSRMFTSQDGNILVLQGMAVVPDGGVVVMATPAEKPTLLRLSNTGTIIWQKELDLNADAAGAFQNITLKDNYLYAGGNINYDSYSKFDGFLAKIDVNNGKTIWTKKYLSSTGHVWIREIISVDSTLMINITAASGQPNLPTIGGYMRLDTAGKVLDAKIVSEKYVPSTIVGPFGAGSTHMVKSDKSFYIISAGSVSLSLQPGISYITQYIKIDSSYNISWVQQSGGAGVPRFFHNAPAPNDGMAIMGNELGSALSPNRLGLLLSLKILDSSGGNMNSPCHFGIPNFVELQPSITHRPVTLASEVNSSYTPQAGALPLYNFFPEMRFKCPDYVDSCSFIKLTGPSSICNLTGVYTYKTHKNKGCGQPNEWQLPAGTQTVSQTDSSISVRFPAFGRYVIYARNVMSCVPVEDSVVVIAASKTPPLQLGPDQQICPSNTIILHAGPKFMEYEWQDGSKDSTLMVNQPGIYWVKAKDSCDNIVSDTVRVTLSPPIPFSVGPDRTKCNVDTIRLAAPDGFMNYKWSPAYNMSSDSEKIIAVSPLVDTVYTVIAEKMPGCFAYDTINIKVFRSPSITLGPDKSFCQGDSVIFDAGAGFTNYSWNNGARSPQITVKSAGSYQVIAETAEGCKSYDTINVVSVYALPVPSLDPAPVLCEGTRTLLDPGVFASYLWNNGSSSQAIQVTTPGRYEVQVTDKNGCSGTAATTINQVAINPSSFLGIDTLLCSYGNMELKPIRSFNKYLWSNGSTSSAIKISTPGIYWLEVKDDKGCMGKDTIVVGLKDCLVGFHIPTAFTPNGDGTNDKFRPLIFGNIKYYRFRVYNRWGQVVFQSTTPGEGWNGKVAGLKQDSNVFVWECIFQLEGDTRREEKGKVVLVN